MSAQESSIALHRCVLSPQLHVQPHGSRLAGHQVCLQDDACILTASGDETVRLWDAGRAAALGVFEGHSGSVKSVATQPSCQQVIASGEGSDQQEFTRQEPHTATEWLARMWPCVRCCNLGVCPM